MILHGGGGHNYEVAHSFGLNSASGPPSKDSIDWAWLTERRLIAVFPQGQSLADAPVAFTWSNHVMDSGEDDVAFLQALAEHLRRRYSVSNLYLVGHSNGGMMANRMWCESPTTFDAYVSIAGPGSRIYLDSPELCSPGTGQPYYGIVGSEDSVLQVAGDWDALTWKIATPLVLAAARAFVNPELLGEWQQFVRRAQGLCGDEPALASPAVEGPVSTWTACDDRLRLARIAGGEHSIESLESAAGRKLVDVEADFLEHWR